MIKPSIRVIRSERGKGPDGKHQCVSNSIDIALFAHEGPCLITQGRDKGKKTRGGTRSADMGKIWETRDGNTLGGSDLKLRGY